MVDFHPRLLRKLVSDEHLPKSGADRQRGTTVWDRMRDPRKSGDPAVALGGLCPLLAGVNLRPPFLHPACHVSSQHTGWRSDDRQAEQLRTFGMGTITGGAVSPFETKQTQRPRTRR